MLITVMVNKMTKHVHAEMIKAKADNMDLVKFNFEHGEWVVALNQSKIQFSPNGRYFLCLPQHKEACLHWLNGGDIQFRPFSSNFEWKNLGKSSGWSWHKLNNTMDTSLEFRIKPRKEKRHIYISTLGATTYAKKTKEEAAREVNIMGGSFDVWKHYEIEIEVEI